MIEFEAELTPRGPAAAFLLDDAQVAAIGGGRKAFPVRVTIGEYGFRGRLARMGGENMIGLSRAAREAGGLVIGERYAIRVEFDGEERTVEVPEALAAALDSAGLRAEFDKLSYSNRKEIARSVAEAARAETRERRIARALELLDG